MKSAVYEGIEKIVVKETDRPVCGKDNIMLRVRSCAICGTDVRTFHHGKKNVVPPQIIGHEIAGEIVEKGKSVTNFSVGDRVAVAPIVSCGNCYYCRKSLENLCENFTAIGYEHPGGFAEYMLVPPRSVVDGSVNIIPENVSFDEAALAEPFACAINGQELSGVSKGDIVVIFGAGAMGCMHIVLARSRGASKIILIELSKKRLKMAEKFKADTYINPAEEGPVDKVLKQTNNRGADVIIVAAPSGKAQEQAVEMVGYRGRVNLFGGLSKDNPYIKLDSNIVHYKEVFVHGSSGSLPRHNHEALKLFGSGRVRPEEFISFRFPLDKILEGIARAESGGGLKVVINPFSVNSLDGNRIL